ncbi:hypothetical protein [Aliiroseovarius sp. 2305UL8-7]|uniref:hypothetical protein n=1 Tax=Aliiroseovarius conchicola TaxID=3121637 RepID=UPI003526FAC4
MRLLILFAVFAATPLAAQDLDARYAPIGAFEGMLGDAPVSLVATMDLERDKSSVTIDNRSGFPIIGARTRSIGSDGKLTSPGIAFLFGPLMPGASSDAEVTIMSESGFYVAKPDLDGRVPVVDLEYSETSLSFAIEAMISPVIRVEGEFEPDPDRQPIAVSGRFEATPDWKN